jgi:hypothetical protein
MQVFHGTIEELLGAASNINKLSALNLKLYIYVLERTILSEQNCVDI